MKKHKSRSIKTYAAKTVLIIFVLYALFWVADFIFSQKAPGIIYGITFSSSYTRSLGLNPDEVYQSIIDDLKVKNLRIPVYWNLVERNEDQFNFKEIDHMLDLARDKNIQVILSIGYKLPRWPECYQPSWAIALGRGERQEKILNLLNQTVEHFKERKEISRWQVENEPLLNFGLCEQLDSGFLEKEVAVVKSLDSRPIILTDSGELGSWLPLMRSSDIMGTTLYRTVWNPIFGFFNYPLPPLFYNLKANLVKKFSPNNSKVIISELQAEPWAPGNSIQAIPLNEQLKIFSLNQFKDNINYAQRTGFDEQYLWGAEWWYWMKKLGHPEYWEYAKTLFQ